MPYKNPEDAKAYQRRRRSRPEYVEYQKTYKEAHRDKLNEYSGEWRKKNPDRVRYFNDLHHLKKYDMTPEQYRAMYEAQGGKCACCGTDEPGPRGKRLHVDHDHTTGKVRGLVCHHCNLGIGHLGDSLEGVERAVAYLRRNLAPMESA